MDDRVLKDGREERNDGRLSRSVLWEPGGEIPPGHPALLEPTVAKGEPIGPSILAEAREILVEAMPTSLRIVIRAHLLGAHSDDLVELRDRILTHPRANKIGTLAITLVRAAAPWSGAGCQPTAEDILAFLGAGRPGSEQLRAAVVAETASDYPALRTALLRALLGPLDDTVGRGLLIGLQEMVGRGHGAALATDLVTLPIPVEGAAFGRTVGLVKYLTELSADRRYELANWWVGTLAVDSVRAASVYLHLISDDPARVRDALPYLSAMTGTEQQRLIAGVIGSPGRRDVETMRTIVDCLDGIGIRPLGPLRARLAAALAAHDQAARAQLIALVSEPSQRVAAQALFHLGEAARAGESWLTATSLTGLADLDRPEARLGALQVTTVLLRNGRGRPAEIVTWLAADHRRKIAGRDEHPAHTAAMLELLHSYLRGGTGRNQDVLSGLLQFLTDRLDPMPDDLTVRKAAFALAKTAVIHPDNRLAQQLGEWAVRMVDSTDLTTTGDRLPFAKEILGRVIESGQFDVTDLVRRARRWPAANQVVLVDVVARQERLGAESPLLDEMLSWPGGAEVARAIWKRRARS